MSEELKPFPNYRDMSRAELIAEIERLHVEHAKFQDTIIAAWNRRDTTALKQEREECAKIADMRKAKADSAIAKSPVGSTRQAEATARFSEADTIAAAIRRRGE